MAGDTQPSGTSAQSEPSFVRCARCRDRIGAYERHLWQGPDGTVVPAAVFAGSNTAPPADWRPYHEACLVAPG